MNTRPLNRRERMLAAGTIAVLVSGLAYIYALEPMAALWMDAHAEANDAAAELGELKALVANRTEIEQQFENYASGISRGDSRNALEVDFLRKAESLASQSDVRVTTMKPLLPRNTGRMQRIGIEMQAVCTAPNLLRLLQTLQEPANLIQADALTISAGRDDPPLTVTMTLSKLVYVDEKARTENL